MSCSTKNIFGNLASNAVLQIAYLSDLWNEDRLAMSGRYDVDQRVAQNPSSDNLKSAPVNKSHVYTTVEKSFHKSAVVKIGFDMFIWSNDIRNCQSTRAVVRPV